MPSSSKPSHPPTPSPPASRLWSGPPQYVFTIPCTFASQQLTKFILTHLCCNLVTIMPANKYWTLLLYVKHCTFHSVFKIKLWKVRGTTRLMSGTQETVSDMWAWSVFVSLSPESPALAKILAEKNIYPWYIFIKLVTTAWRSRKNVLQSQSQ